MNNKQIIQVRNHLLNVSQASLTDIKGNREKLYHFSKQLDRLYVTVGLLRNATMDQITTQFVNLINMTFNMRYMSRILKFYMAHLEMQMHEYQDLMQTINHFPDGLSTVNTG